VSAFAAVVAAADDAGTDVVRAWPRDAGHLLLELAPRDAAGDGRVAAQWFADTGRAGKVAGATPGARLHGSLVLQPGGADRRLTALRNLAASGRLVAHRPEHRAVVRRTEAGRTVYAKTTRGSRFASLVSAARTADGLPLCTPPVLAVDPGAHVVVLGSLPGRPLHDVLDTPLATTAARRLGETLARLHAQPVPPGTAVHDGAAELAVARTWAGHAHAYGVGPADVVLSPPPDVPAAERVLVHRDLHDKQVLVGDDGSVGLLDFDLVAAGDPALDLANLRQHLALRRQQGLCADDEPLWAAVLDGYRPGRGVLDRVPGWQAVTAARLDAVYAFRHTAVPT
jgi:hypothetical protein